jgi:hypothetical protein
MSLALVALIIALASLMWNVVSTVYSWQFSKPVIRVNSNPHWQGGESWFSIEVQNRGGSPIEVTGVFAYYAFQRKWVWSRSRSRIGRLKRSVLGDAISPASRESVRYTIQAYHAHEWRIDRYKLFEAWMQAKRRSSEFVIEKEFVIEVELATGKRVFEKVLAEVFADEAAAHMADLDRPEQSQLPGKDDRPL